MKKIINNFIQISLFSQKFKAILISLSYFFKMSGFLQFLSRIAPQNQPAQHNNMQQTQQQAHHQPKPSDRILSLWNAICTQTLNDKPESLNEIHQLLINMLKYIQQSFTNNFKNSIIETFSQHQIPKQLVTFGLANIPKGLINEVIYFFIFFTKTPFQELLPEPYIIGPLNTLIEKLPEENGNLSDKLINGLLQYISLNPDKIPLFLTSEETSPLIEQFSRLLMNESYHLDFGPILIRLFYSMNSIPGLMNYILTYSPLIQTILDICKGCIEKGIDNPNQNFLIECINCAVNVSPYDFQQVFAALFDEDIIKPLILHADAIQSLSLSIYVLCSFSSVPLLIEPVHNHILSNFELYMKSNLETIIFLTIRCITLMLETSTKIIFLSPENQPETIKIFLGFMNLLRAEWFVKPEIVNQLANSQSRVSMMLSNKNNDKNSIIKKREDKDIKDFEKIDLILDLRPIFKGFLNVLEEKYLDSNSLRVNLALTEFFSGVAAIAHPDASFFALSEECQDGLVKSLSNICTIFLRRIGQKPGTIEAINEAYRVFNDKTKSDKYLNFLMKRINDIDINNTKNNNQVFGNNYEQENMFLNLVIMIEFLKELQAIAQSKNIYHQQASIIMSEYL